MSVTTQFKLLLFLWNVGVIDTLTFLQIGWNTGAQYCAIVGASAAGNWSNISPFILFEPINGLRISTHYILAGATRAEQRNRLATITGYLVASTGSAIQLDPSTNIALGGTIAAKIAYMKAVLARGGGGTTLLSDSIQNNVTNSHCLSIASSHDLIKKKNLMNFYAVLNNKLLMKKRLNKCLINITIIDLYKV